MDEQQGTLRFCNARNRYKILAQAVREVFDDALVDDKGVSGVEQGVSVGRGVCHNLCADDAVCSTAIIDDDLLPDLACYLFCYRPCIRILSTTGGGGHDQTDGSIGEGLRPGTARPNQRKPRKCGDDPRIHTS